MLMVIGNLGPDPDKTINHAYNAYPTPDGKDHYLIETTGDRLVKRLPILSKATRYRNVIGCDARGEYTVWLKDGSFVC